MKPLLPELGSKADTRAPLKNAARKKPSGPPTNRAGKEGEVIRRQQRDELTVNLDEQHAPYLDALHLLYRELLDKPSKSVLWQWPVKPNTPPSLIALRAAIYVIEERIPCPQWIKDVAHSPKSINADVTNAVNKLRREGKTRDESLIEVARRYQSSKQWADKHYWGIDPDDPPRTLRKSKKR